MMITFHLAGSGQHGESRVPKLSQDIDSAYDEKTHSYDRAAILKALGTDLVATSFKDSTNCLAVGATILQEFHHNIEKIEGVQGKDFKHKPSGSCSGAERNLYKGRCAYVRLRLTDTADGNLKCRVSYSNPKNIPGTCYEFAHDIALYLIQIIDGVALGYATNGSTVRLNLVDHEDCKGLVAEAREDHLRRKSLHLIKWLNERRHMCKCCLASGHCSPIHPKCRFYKNGLCTDIETV